jgi:hypothetical protein
MCLNCQCHRTYLHNKAIVACGVFSSLPDESPAVFPSDSLHDFFCSAFVCRSISRLSFSDKNFSLLFGT